MNTSSLIDLLSHTALKGAAVLLVALLLSLVLRRMAAARRYAVWITAITTLAILPLAMWLLPAWHVLPPTSTALDWPGMELTPVSAGEAPFLLPEDLNLTMPAPRPASPIPAQVAARPAFSWNVSWQDVVDYLPAAWLLIAGFLLLRLGSGAWRLHRLEASLIPGECALLDQTARELELRRLPRLFIGPRDSVPMVWGVLRPRLLLPQGFEDWSREKQRGVLLHELAHLKRGDPLALWAAQWVKALHWFNPLVWLTFRQLRADQERACDDAVLRHGVRASDYAQCLLDLSRHGRLASRLSLCALTMTRCAPVEARVQAILDSRRRREGLNGRWLAGLAGCALLITLPVAMLHAIEDAMLRGRILDRNGLVLAESTKEKARLYPLKTLAAHLVGYARLPGSDDARLHGGAGMEKQEDAVLQSGKDVTLTLDARIQALALAAMKDGGVERGAAVVIDPRTGEILASVSLPSFDPNLFIPSLSHKDWDRYLKDRDLPLYERCITGQFVPGSTFLPLTALAGISAGVDDRSFECNGEVMIGGKAFPCWIHGQNNGRHGRLGMTGAIVNSCGCFWYQFGIASGMDALTKVGSKIGMGQKYGLLENESAGVLPSPAWLAEKRSQERWGDGHTANASIGQGMVLATPLQLAVLAATVGNRGKIPQPQLLTGKQSAWRADLIADGLPAAQIEVVCEGMRLAVNGDSGTGRPARSTKVMIAGKTGTAQNWRRIDGEQVADNNAWFIGFAPFDKPTLAFAILKQGGKTGGGDCGPIAKRIVEESLALPADGSGEVKPVESAWKREDLPTEKKPNDAQKELARLMLQLKQTQDKIEELEEQIKAGASATLEQQREALAQQKRELLQSMGMVASSARAKTIFTGKMRPADQERWQRLRISEGLADMPAEAMLSVTTPEGRLAPALFSEFRFAASKDAAHRWLVASLSQKEQEELNWPAPGESFQRVFHTQKGCSIHVRYPGGDMVEVTLWKPTPLIVPDDASPDMRYTADAAASDTSRVAMRRVEAEQWKGLQVQGRLAPLPECAVVSEMAQRDPRWLQLEFSAPREAARRWLLDSLSEQMRARQAAALLWPAVPEVFQRSYTAADRCDITVQYGDADLIHVIISKQKPRIMIAPDEATPPRPKTAAPRALDGVVNAEEQVPLKDPLYPEQVPLIDGGKTPPLQLRDLQPLPSPQERQMMKDAMAQRGGRNNFSKALLVSARE